MKQTLSYPFKISARTLPALLIGDTWLSLDEKKGKPVFYFDAPDWKWTCTSIGYPPAGRTHPQSTFRACLSFLSAAAEAEQHTIWNNRKSENYDLFPERIMEWAHANSDEIGMLACEIEETKDLIVEE